MNVISMVKASLLIMLLLFLAGASFTLHNLYRLNSIKSSFAVVNKNISIEMRDLVHRIEKLEEFEKKITLFLGGSLSLAETANINMADEYNMIGMGGGEEQEAEEPYNRQEPTEPKVLSSFAPPYRSEQVKKRVQRLINRLDQLVSLALKEKHRLDYTPSIWPAPGYVTSNFGWRRSPFTGQRHFHRGIDLMNRTGTPIRGTAAGRVTKVSDEKFWGKTIAIEHLGGTITRFGHLSSFNVSVGDSVRRGDVIGYMGASGRSTGPHLHYQIEINGGAVDPMQFIIEDSY